MLPPLPRNFFEMDYGLQINRKNILLNQIYDPLVIPPLLMNLVLCLIYIKVNFLYIKREGYSYII